MHIQIFIESNDKVIADKRFVLNSDNQVPENIRESIQEIWVVKRGN